MELPFLHTFGIRLHYLVHEEKYFKVSFEKYDDRMQVPMSGQEVSNDQKQLRKAKGKMVLANGLSTITPEIKNF